MSSSTSSRLQRRRLDDILVDEGLVSKEDVQEAVHIRKKTGETLGEILVDMGSLSGPDISRVVCLHYQLPFISFESYEIDPRLLKLLPPEFMHQHKLVPFDSIGDMLLCAVTEIPSGKVLTEIPKLTKRKVALYVAYLEAIHKHLQEHCPLAEDSELVKRRRAVIADGQRQSAESADKNQLFAEQSSADLMEALDSTWDTIFEAVEESKKTDDQDS